MALDIRFSIPSRLVADIQQAPRIFAKHFDRGAGRAALEVSRTAQRESPKAFSTYRNSIHVSREPPFSYRVAPSVDYAPAIEGGTGRGGFPKERHLLDWIRVKRIQPNDPTMSERDLAYVMARSIFRKGTPANPVMGRTAEKMQGRVVELLRRSLADGLREARLA